MTSATPLFLRQDAALTPLIAALDWSATSLGPIDGWGSTLRHTVSTMLHSAVPMVALWGEDGVMIYNDGYAEFAGPRHPASLGCKVREGWPEIADFNDGIIRAVLGEGRTLSYAEQELTILRSGQPEQVWLDLEYSAVVDDAGKRVAVLVIVLEVTRTVVANRARDTERDRLRQMFEQGPSFMALLSGPDHVFELVNPAYRKLIGDRDVVGKTVRDALPELVDQGYHEMLDTAFATGKAVSRQAVPVLLMQAETGQLTERRVNFAFQPVRAPNGEIKGIFVLGSDITDQHHAETAAADSAARFEVFAQAMPGHAWTARPDGTLDWFNQQVFDYSGLAPRDLDDGAWTTLVHPDDADAAGATWATALATGDVYETEFRVRRHDGIYRWHLVRALSVRDNAGAIVRWIGTNTDIHDRKLAEAASARDRDRIWTLSPVLKLVASGDGMIVDVNPSWTAALGWTHEQSVGRNVLEFLPPDDKEIAIGRLGSLAVGQEIPTRESHWLTAMGEQRLIEWTSVREGDTIYSFGRDVTDKAAAAQALALTEEALRQAQKMEAVGQLTGGIAHDFNNLLQGITGSLEIVSRRISQGRTDNLDRFITGATTAANRAAALTHRLLAFSRRQPLDPRSVRVNPLLESMEDLLRRTLGEQVMLELVLADGLWTTLCDPNQLENAVLNLAINARDAMPEGGRLTIETCNTHLDDAYAASQRDVSPGPYVCLCVTDCGTGMDADTIARAFDPFFTTKPIGQGTGLGLSMIYGFARQSEGHARIYSEVGQGTTIKLYLPRHRGEAEEDEPLPVLTEAHVAEGGETVLVVEDEPVVRGLIVEVLGELGYRALEAGDGPAGLAMLQSPRTIDLLITDIGLPGLNGRQVADAARSLRPELPVLFMTGYAENAALASGFLEPGMAMITKPFAVEALATRIRDILGAR